MKKQRYIIENVPEGELGQVAAVVKGQWHGIWLDSETLFLLAEVDVDEAERLAAHPDCHVFESQHDTTPFVEQRQKFLAKQQGRKKLNSVDYLDKHGISPTDTVAQTGLKIARIYKNPHLEP